MFWIGYVNCPRVASASFQQLTSGILGLEILRNILNCFSEMETEKDVLDLTTSEEKCVVHFYHEDFRRCAIIDTHLKVLEH